MTDKNVHPTSLSALCPPPSALRPLPSDLCPPTLNGGLGGYWKYPTRSDDDPGRDLNDPGGNHANYDADWATGVNGGYIPIDDPFFTTEVGHFARPSAYGTFDQGGNVREWTEAKGGDYAYTHGGWYKSGADELEATAHRQYLLNGRATECLGFRIATPEPGGVAALIGMAAVGLLWSWRRR